jgi:hypothetical protein
MKRSSILATIALLLSLLTACGSSPPPPAAAPAPAVKAAALPPSPPPTPPVETPPTAPARAAEDPATGRLTPPIPVYRPKGRRDPFAPLDLKKVTRPPTIASARLTGIVRGGESMLALVEMPDGIAYIVRPGDELADGRVVAIGRDSIDFLVASGVGASPQRITLTLAALK